MKLIAALNLFPPVLFVLLHLAEALFPARRHATSVRWRVSGLLWFLVSGVLFSNLPLLWSAWLGEHSLLDLSSLGLWGAPLSLLVGNFIGYFWHRARHQVPALWRLHQLHHASERHDVSGAFVFHPLETVVVAFLFSATSIGILGLSPDAAALAGAGGFFCAAFQHANIRTPRWLGYIIQRPESHSVHHSRGVHANNYADLPIYDLLFGTHENPKEQASQVGFYDGGDRRIGRMLLGLDNSAPPVERAIATPAE